MKRMLAAAILLPGLAACSQHPVRPEASAHVPAHRAETRLGENVVAGRAAVVRPGSAVATCAGDAATLIPATPRTRRRMEVLYGPGQRFVLVGTAPALPRDPAIERQVLKARCDGEGRFRFDHVPDGTWFVTAGVPGLGDGSERGSVRGEVTVQGGEHRTVLLTN